MIENIKKIIKYLTESDSVVIGAGAGLSTAAGLNYSGSRFTENFYDFIQKFNLKDMYTAMFYNFPSIEEKWAYVSRHIKLNRYDSVAGDVYSNLLNIVRDKNYFVITTNADGLFKKAGFNVNKLFATQGDYSYFQCQQPCTDKLYYNQEIIEEMVKTQIDCKIMNQLIPKCPKCGQELIPHLRIDNTFIENDEWKAACNRYRNFINDSAEKKILFIELGVGFNTPTIIRWSFEKMVYDFKAGYLIRLNLNNTECNLDISNKSLLIQDDIAAYIQEINNRM